MCVAKSPTIFIFYRLWGKIANRPCCSGYAGWSIEPGFTRVVAGKTGLIGYAYKKNNHKKKQATK